MELFYDIGVFVVVLGELVFFHELGHFLAAKACGIYCERFSLGMPPRLFGFKFGETDYCIGLLPIGGYVKMAGQEDVPLSEDERKEQYGSVPPDRWFMNKPVWQRVIVIFAGPFMNIVLAMLLYGIIAGVGMPVSEAKHDNRIGSVEPNSPASTAPLFIEKPGQTIDFTKQPDAVGLKTGDRILSVDDNSVTNIMDVAIDAVLSGGKTVMVAVERTNADGSTTRYLSPVAPRKLEGADQIRIGVRPFRTALVDAVMDDMPAAAAGIKKGDTVTRLNGEIVDSESFLDVVTQRADGQPIQLEVESDGAKKSLSVTPNRIGRFKDIMFSPPLEWPSLFRSDKPLKVEETDPKLIAGTGFVKGDTIAKVNNEAVTEGFVKKLSERSPDEKLQVVVDRKGFLGLGAAHAVTLSDITVHQLLQAITSFDIDAKPVVSFVEPKITEATGLQAKDIVEEIDGKPATVAMLKEMQDTRIGQSVSIKVRKPAIGYGVMRGETMKEVKLDVAAVGMVGIIWGEKSVFYKAKLGDIVPEAWNETWKQMKVTVRTLVKLFTGGLSTKELGGPMMIYQATTTAARVGGIIGLLETTAFISVNLAIFNLLPLPVLDGGHLLFLSIEGVRRKPVSARFMEWVQQAGLVVIIGLMLFVTFNDIRRWIQNLVP